MLPGAEFSWGTEPGGVPDTAPTPLYPVRSLHFFLFAGARFLMYDAACNMQTHTHYLQAYVVPLARKVNPEEQSEVDHYRHLRERFHDGPYYSVLDASSSSAKKGSAARINFDPFHGMPSWSGRYQKKRRTLPKIDPNEREYSEFTQAYRVLFAGG